MIALIQTVKEATCVVKNEKIASISNGYLIYLGIKQNDEVQDINFIVNKISNLRIFPDENQKINLDINSISGEILIISNFTLLGNAFKNNRPSFKDAADFNTAEKIYNLVCDKIAKQTNIKVQKGIFGADMKIVSEVNGPVNLIVNSRGKHYE